MKWKRVSILGSLVILMGGLPAYLCASVNGDSSVNAEAEEWITAESQREHAVQVMSKYVCGEQDEARTEFSKRECVSVFVEMAAKAVKSQEYISPSIENVNWSDPAEFDEITSEVGYSQEGAEASDLKVTDGGAILANEKEIMSTEPDDIVVTRDVDNAIPGSLLVTILALVGIVAVARRDVSGKQNPDPVARPGAEVARMSTLRDGAKVDILHERLN